MQPRSRRFGPPRGNHLGHTLHHQCGNNDHINQIRKQHHPQERRCRRLHHRPQNNIGQHRKKRPQKHKPDHGHVLHRTPAPPATEPCHVSTCQATLHAHMPLIQVRFPPHTTTSRALPQIQLRPVSHAYVAVLHQFAAPCHADIQLCDLLSQSIAVDPEQIRAFGLISSRGVQCNFNQRAFDLAQDSGI